MSSAASGCLHDKGKHGAHSWRISSLKILRAGAFLAVLLGSPWSSGHAQNARRSGVVDGPHNTELETKAGASSSTQSTTGAAAQTGDRSSEMGGCPTQQPFLLKKYGLRPNWPVAGVDYCVGYVAGAVFKKPATISMAGVSVDSTRHIVTVTGDNITLEGYDFSLDGGWQVNVQAANTTIENSHFVVGSNDQTPIIGTQTASKLEVVNCTIDGAGNDTGPWGGLISYRGNGFTIEYSRLMYSGGDMIQQIDGGAGSKITIEHNLIQDGGLAPGSHGDYTQFAGGPFTVAINYNTTVQNGGNTQGLMTEFVAEGEIGHNTMIGAVSYFVSVDLSSITTTFRVHDNYFDPQGYGFAYPSNKTGVINDFKHKLIFSNNVNMRTGVVVQAGPP